MFSALTDILIGVITSVVIGSAVLSWRKFQNSKKRARKAHFFKIIPNSNCYITMNYSRDSNRMSHNDVYAMIEVSKIVHELRGELLLLPVHEAKIAPGEYVEFCIGGPDSNPRTKTLLTTYLRGLKINSYKDEVEPLAIKAGNATFKYYKQEIEYVVLAKILPKRSSYPVFLISGQTSITNRGAAYFLAANFESIFKNIDASQEFCFILRLQNPYSYGHKIAELEKDVTSLAFTKPDNSQDTVVVDAGATT